MGEVLLYGKEHTFLDPKTGLLFRNSSLKQTAPIHTHTFYEIFIVTSGSALHLVNGAIQTVNTGDLVFIRPRDVHSYEFYYSEDFQIINVGFSRQLFQDVQMFLGKPDLMQPLLDSEIPACVHTGEEERAYLISRCLEIGALMEMPAVLQTVLYAKCCLADLFSRCFFVYDRDQQSSHYPVWFQAMLNEMQKIDNLRIGYPKMLELSLCSSNHLSRVFRSLLSVTPTDYINEKRLEYSVYLLSQTQDDILEICSSCGFSSLSHFYHLFKKKYQCSPNKFRRALNQQDPVVETV